MLATGDVSTRRPPTTIFHAQPGVDAAHLQHAAASRRAGEDRALEAREEASSAHDHVACVRPHNHDRVRAVAGADGQRLEVGYFVELQPVRPRRRGPGVELVFRRSAQCRAIVALFATPAWSIVE